MKTFLDKQNRVITNISNEMVERRKYVPPICDVFKGEFTTLKPQDSYKFDIHKEAKAHLPKLINEKVMKVECIEKLTSKSKKRFLKAYRIGVVFSGGPAPGGHNVIAGIFDFAKKISSENKIFGFWQGFQGLLDNEFVEITKDMVDHYRNFGGFTMIKTGRTKIDTKEKLETLKRNIDKLNLDALVIIGGDDSNTNAAFIAEELYDEGVQVIGVPKTIDGDVQVKDKNGTILCATSFGFHTAARAFSKNISNLGTDASSDMKYWHICKVMGRVASHLALESAFQTHANLTLIGEEIADYVDEERVKKAKEKNEIDYTAYGLTLRHLSRTICNKIMKRAKVGKNFGILILPEGILEFINEIQIFIIKLNTIIAEYNKNHDKSFNQVFATLESKLAYLKKINETSKDNISIWNDRDNELFNAIPDFFQKQLLIERDVHGNFQFSLVETDKIVMKFVKEHLSTLKESGAYKVGVKRTFFETILKEDNLPIKKYGETVFKNYNSNDDYLIVKESIISFKTLKSALLQEGLIKEQDDVPFAIKKIYDKSNPKFQMQTHFYGYDGRGSDPTMFDCNYAYNLGFTVFSLISGGATGCMASIKNLEKEFEEWQPIGIPIAPLMHIEERGGKLMLVIEKSVVDLDSNAFKAFKNLREDWLCAYPGEDNYRKPGPIRFKGMIEEDRPITLVLNSI